MDFWSKQNVLNEVSRDGTANILKDEQEVQGALPRTPSVSSDDSMYWEVPVRVFIIHSVLILVVCANMFIHLWVWSSNVLTGQAGNTKLADTRPQHHPPQT